MFKLYLFGVLALLCSGAILEAPIVLLVKTMLDGLARAGI